MDPVEIFRGHHISNFEKKIREITDYYDGRGIHSSEVNAGAFEEDFTEAIRVDTGTPL